MHSCPHSIKKMTQCDQYHFSIEWSDNKVSRYSMAQLQRNCPCRKCRDGKTGGYIHDVRQIPETLKAKKIVSVGNYALRIEFDTGCQYGIYTYGFLRKLAQLEE